MGAYECKVLGGWSLCVCAQCGDLEKELEEVERQVCKQVAHWMLCVLLVCLRILGAVCMSACSHWILCVLLVFCPRILGAVWMSACAQWILCVFFCLRTLDTVCVCPLIQGAVYVCLPAHT